MVKLSVTPFSMDGSPSHLERFLSGKGINQKKKENVMLLHFSLVTKVTKEVFVKVDPFCRKIGTKRRG